MSIVKNIIVDVDKYFDKKHRRYDILEMYFS
jgi:hypothetical protein